MRSIDEGFVAALVDQMRTLAAGTVMRARLGEVEARIRQLQTISEIPVGEVLMGLNGTSAHGSDC